MTPQLVDHAHAESCIVIGCNSVRPRRKMNVFISGCSHIAVASRSRHSRSHNCEHRFRTGRVLWKAHCVCGRPPHRSSISMRPTVVDVTTLPSLTHAAVRAAAAAMPQQLVVSSSIVDSRLRPCSCRICVQTRRRTRDRTNDET